MSTDKLYSPAVTKEIINRYDFHLSKSLGQNFLVDGNIVRSIIEGAEIEKDDLVIEVGPGLGVLTAAAADKADTVVGIEIDSNLIPILKETLKGHDNVHIINDDFLKTDLDKLISGYWNKGRFGGVKFIGNLPYYITSPIIMRILEEQSSKSLNIKSMTFMMQREVGERIKAMHGSKAYGTLSIAVQYYCSVKAVVTVPKTVFVPRPKVDSIVLNLEIMKEPLVKVSDSTVFFSLVKTSFSQRRKMLANSMVGIKGMDKPQIESVLYSAGIDPMRRAETLTLDEFAAIANIISEK
jgi:16S rRNA (adenine1518-N6/adenine1519-N6)-dimethyltransferase